MTTSPSTLLQVRDLRVTHRTRSGAVTAVRGIDLDVAGGEVVAIVGESGSGKSTTAHTLTGLLPSTTLATGSAQLAGRELLGLDEGSLRAIRGRRIGLVPQDPTVSLNPVRRIGVQVAEVLLAHGLADRRQAREQALELLAVAGVPNPRVRARQYPHELSGGLRQRVLIAIAIAADPELVVADEPTSALDVTVQRQILDHLQQLVADRGTSLLLITHDLAIAADRADRLVVMRHGAVVEHGPVDQLLDAPEQDYTRRLWTAAPRLDAPGPVPPSAQDLAAPPVVVVRGLSKDFAAGRGMITAVDQVSFELGRGQTLALVGESGSGKTTTARMVLGLTQPSAGSIEVLGQNPSTVGRRGLRELRRRVQWVQQNPYDSLDPRRSVAATIAEPLVGFGIGTRRSRVARVRELLDQVALPADYAERRPVELSGGERQRVAIARALAVDPAVLVCDEPVSALDVQVQAQVLDLLARLQQQLGLSYLFITHDLAVVRQIAHRVAVMKDGRLIESGPVAQLFDAPQQAWTRHLLDAVPGHRRDAHPSIDTDRLVPTSEAA